MGQNSRATPSAFRTAINSSFEIKKFSSSRLSNRPTKSIEEHSKTFHVAISFQTDLDQYLIRTLFMTRKSSFFFLQLLGTVLLAAGTLLAGPVASETDATVEQTEVNLENYLLAPLDAISITVFGEPELGVNQRISAKGEVFVPLLGSVEIAGLSVEQAKLLLERLFIEQRFLRSPEVTVAISSFSPKNITFLGEVSRSITLPDGANSVYLETAIAMAGGLTNTSRDSGLRVIRKDEEGVERVIEVNLRDVLADDQGVVRNRFKVFPGDIIHIRRRIF